MILPTRRTVRYRPHTVATGLAGFILLLMTAAACGAKQETTTMPAEFKQGEVKFNLYCARCHGDQAAGTSVGPPLVHKIYEPNHHGDVAFQRAAANGVRAHHWKFGDMPKVEGITSDDITQIIAYVRWLQRQAGIM